MIRLDLIYLCSRLCRDMVLLHPSCRYRGELHSFSRGFCSKDSDMSPSNHPDRCYTLYYQPNSQHIYTGTIPSMIRELSSESDLIEVEIIEHTIEIGAWSSIEAWISRDLLYLIEDDGLLGFEWFLLRQEGIVVVAIAVNIIGIDFLEILREFDFKESASCGIGIELASIVPI